jgi:hypothetical protein
VIRWLVLAAVLVVVFAAGVALGQALEDRPEPGRQITSVETIRPWTQTTTP